ncbi:hypothetical protein RJ640_018061 [Escallonia rubra]|uniref:non-specific serine/threonine protein kinase n=1 Tax=Escallonia rubra TaxID=112253 RepID=A0AA88S0M9_9ASTE|nr:hypothetical protein RJ640_018061 [Escallonia rubra]
MAGVYRVDLLTRQISAPEVDRTYGEPTEMLNPITSENSTQEIGESSGAYIVRVPFGPNGKYIPKELLWPHIPEFVDGALSHIMQISKVLGEQIGGGQPVWPVAIHGHYADAGNSAALLSGALNVPMLFTGHSLGRDKLEQLLKQGRQSREEINGEYKIMRRIEAEEISLDASEVIVTLNLSFNDFEGKVPAGRLFENASEVTLDGNSKLCGGVRDLQLPRCGTKHAVSRVLELAIPLSCGIVLLILAFFFVFVYKRRLAKKVSLSNSSMGDILLKVSYGSLYKATEGFSSTNLLGSGQFSSVYKGILEENQTVVAVKVLKLQVRGASKSFMAECEALRNIRHRNLVKILTSCSTIDFQGNDFKALVYSYMANGSLDGWLHQKTLVDSGNEENRGLTLLQRLNIAIDVASALDYLHHHSGTTLVHCDLKPGNVLLDIDLVAHLGDFGLTRILPEATHAFSTSQSSSIGIKGTIGYAAPEYGMGCEISTSGDVYSYGILLLEIFTGKRPTDDMFVNGLNLHNFAKVAVPDRVTEISDPVLFQNEEEEETSRSHQVSTHKKYEKINQCLTSILRIGIACSMELPRERMNISDVTIELHSIRDTFLGRRTPREEDR